MSFDEELLTQKQEYLRKQIPNDFYEDFGEYCNQIVGNIDITTWSLEYTQELVQNFKELKAKEEKQLQEGSMNQQSFHVYQTSDPKDIKNLQEQMRKEKKEAERQAEEQGERVLKDRQDQANRVESEAMKRGEKQRKKKEKYVRKAEKEKAKEKEMGVEKKQVQTKREKTQVIGKSAVALLDSVFDSQNQQQPQTLNEKDFASIGSIISPSSFDNTNFWGATPNPKDFETNKKLEECFSSNNGFFTNMDEKSKVAKGNETQQITMTKKNKVSESDKPSEKDTNKFMKKKNNVQEVDTSPEFKSSESNYCNDNEDQQETSICNELKSNFTNFGQESAQAHYKQNKLPYEGPVIIKETFSDTISCFKSTIRPALAHPNFSVVIHKHEVVHRNFFVADYVMYQVKTLPSSVEVQRNYQDFIKLRRALASVYPGIQLPFLEKAGWLSETHPDTIRKQKSTLEFFLNDIINNQEIRNSRIFEDFLTIKEHKKIKRKFEEYDRMSKLTSIQELCLLSGKVTVKLGEDQRVYQEKMTIYLARMEEYFDRHKKIQESLVGQYDGLMKTFSSLSELMLEIEMETTEFNRRVKCNQIRNLEKTYSTLNKVYKEANENLTFDLDLLNQKVLPFLRYQKENMGTLREIIYARNCVTKSYLKRPDLQFSKSSEIIPYTSDKHKAFKTGIVQDSKSVLVHKYQTAYMNNQVCQESQRFFELLGGKITDRWSDISKRYQEKLEESRIFWEGIVMEK